MEAYRDGSVGRRFRAELRLLTQPTAVITIVCFAVVVTVLAARAVQRVAAQYDGLEGRVTEFHDTCTGLSDPTCPMALLSAARSERALRENAGLAIQVQDIRGALVPVTGMLASLPGAILILILSAVLVCTEFDSRTADIRLARDPRRWRFVDAKLGGVAFGVAAAVVLSWGAVAAIGFAVRAAGALPEVTSSPPQIIATLTRTLPVVIGLMTCGVLLATALRSSVAAVAVGVVTLGVALMLANSASICRLSPVCWTAAWMGFERLDLGTGFIWVTVPAGSSTAFVPVAFVVLALLARGLAIAALGRLSRG